jgi:hypothetical protein
LPAKIDVPAPSAGQKKVLTVSSHPESIAGSNPVVRFESDWLRDLNFFESMALGNALS